MSKKQESKEKEIVDNITEIVKIDNDHNDLQENVTLNLKNIDKKKANKFDIVCLKIWTFFWAVISFVSISFNKIIKFIFRREAPLRYVKAGVVVLIIMLILTSIIAPISANSQTIQRIQVFSNDLVPAKKFKAYETNEVNSTPIYKWGYVSKSNKEVIEFVYDYALPFKHGVAWVLMKDESANANYWHLIGKNGKKKGEIRVEQNNNIETLAVGEFSSDEKIAWVNIGGKYSYIKTNGKPAFSTNYQFDECGNYTDGLARVRNGKIQYYINTRGKIVGSEYEQVRDFSEGFGAIKKNDRWGFVDKKGNIVISPSYDMVSDFKGGYALVKNGKTYGIINTKGASIVTMGEYVDIGVKEIFGVE